MTSLIYLFIKYFSSRTSCRDIDEALKISLDGSARRPFYMNSLIFRLKASSKFCYDGERVEKGFKGFSGNFFKIVVSWGEIVSDVSVITYEVINFFFSKCSLNSIMILRVDNLLARPLTESLITIPFQM